jgi:hypothetical protein
MRASDGSDLFLGSFMRRILPIAVLSVAAITAPAAAATDPVLKQLLAESAKTAFERSLRAEVRPDSEKGPAHVVERFTPTGHSSGRWTLVSTDGKAPTAKQVEQHKKNSAEAVIPGFHRLHLVLSPAPTKRTETGGKMVYLWPSLPEGAVTTPGGDISRNLSAEATVDDSGGKPIISKVRIFAAKPFKIRGIATMNSFEVTSLYRLQGNLPVLVSQTSQSDVKAPFGLGGVRRSVMTYRPL